MNAPCVLILSAAILIAGCSSVETQDEPRDEREYTTGSRLPKKSYPQPASSQVYVPDASSAPYKPLPGPRPSGG